MQDSAEAPIQQPNFNQEIKDLYFTLKSATENLNKHLLCELDGNRFKLFERILDKCRELTIEAKQIHNEDERTEILEKLEQFKRETSVLMVTLSGLVKQAELPRARFQKLLRTIKDL
jgi:hypothetical protein